MFLSRIIYTAFSVFTVISIAVPTRLSAQTLIPVTMRRDMIFDHAGNYLYISTSDGLIKTYNLSTGQVETAKDLGGSLNGLDISPDDSFLLVAQNDTGVAQGVFEKVDLSSGAITNINYTLAFGETGAWDVAIASNGLAFGTTQFGGSGWTPLRQIDLTTNQATIRADAPGSGGGGMVRQNTAIYRSADRTRLYFLEANISSGPVFTYSAETDTFGPVVDTDACTDCGDAGVNRDGTLVGTRLYSAGLSLDTAPDFNFVHSFDAIDGGIAFNAVEDIVYGVDSVSDEIIGYDTNNFIEQFRRKIGEDVGDSRDSVTELVADQNGRYLALATPSGIRLIPTLTANLANISTRLLVETGDNVLIGGFIVTGTSSKSVLLRAIGPSLSLDGKLANPILELHDASGAVIATNDDWQTNSNKQEIIDTGIAPTDPLESALLFNLDPGAYTAIVSGASNGTGIALVEAYDLDLTTDSKLANISTRGFVQTGDNVMIGGFIILGNEDENVLIRAIGPSLPLADTLADPLLELHDADGSILAMNDNWRDTQEAEIQATGIPPTNDAESAIISTLAPGNYTGIVSGVGDTTGLALVEAYALN
jgi:hypothetical protein